MNSISLLCIETLLCFVTLIFLYKHYKVLGLYAYTITALILSCLMSLKTITIYDFDINLGMIPFITIFTSFNILIQKKGPDDTKNLLLTLITTLIVSYSIFYLISFMKPSNINLFTSASYDNIFNSSLRMYFSNIVTVLYSLLLNTKLYYYLKKMKNNILISNLFSTIIIQFLASVLFGLISYIFIKEYLDIIKIIMIRYLISLIVGLIGTIPIYITKYIKEK
ncbi:MAG: queuosine precursor transporter [Erysipelotrichaceae bacterium]|nr:queuosine precursor transporter [Erysipelotrichaceae bacterium]